MSAIEVLSPGLLTTVQDLGREGFGPMGVSPSGVSSWLMSNHSSLNSIRLLSRMAMFVVRAMIASAIATLPSQRGRGRSFDMLWFHM